MYIFQYLLINTDSYNPFIFQTNILVNNQFNACIADFGLAQLVSNQQGNGSSVSRSGSLRWMAPELHAPERFGFQ
jgi:serine/threonine protein kinase